MISSRPKPSVVASFLVVLIASLVLIVVNSIAIAREYQAQWINYLIVAVLAPIAAFIFYKVVLRYKVVRMGNAQVEVRYPLFGHKAYPLKEIIYWKETVIPTGKTSTYKELEIKFSDDKKVTMGFREYSEYEKMFSYLMQKANKQRQL